MGVTYGFYNSLNGDRRYNAEQMSSIFEGIISDGVFATIGTAFSVSPADGMTVNVGIGRAWFNRTWTYNDANLPLTLDYPETAVHRIDAIVIEVNSSDDVRANAIKVINGRGQSSSETPGRPPMENTDFIHQYPIAYIYVPSINSRSTTGRAEGTILASDITYVVGNTAEGGPPFITGVIETITTDILIAQWQGEFDETMESNQAEWRNWYNLTTAADEAEFDAWFETVKDILDNYGDASQAIQAIASLQNEVSNATIIRNDVSVPASAWASDNTYEDYPYRAAVAINGVTTAYVPTVVFPVSALSEYSFAPVNETYAGGVYIYCDSVPESAITLPTVMCQRKVNSIT